MPEYIGCRNCKSPDCKGCNLKNLETMLNNGKFDCMMNENRCINPAFDVAPVRHGRWKNGFIDTGDGPMPERAYLCGQCGKAQWRKSRYCPNCGARMDGDNNA